jgi:hypothetical protein
MANRQQFKQSRENGLKEALSPLQTEQTTSQIPGVLSEKI